MSITLWNNKNSVKKKKQKNWSRRSLTHNYETNDLRETKTEKINKIMKKKKFNKILNIKHQQPDFMKMLP